MPRLPVYDPICEDADDVREQARHVAALRTIGIRLTRKAEKKKREEAKAPEPQKPEDDIFQIIAKKSASQFSCPSKSIFSKSKDPYVVKARTVAIYLLKEFTGMSGEKLAWHVKFKRAQSVNQYVRTAYINVIHAPDSEISKAINVISKNLREEGIFPPKNSHRRKDGDAYRREMMNAGLVPTQGPADVDVASCCPQQAGGTQ